MLVDWDGYLAPELADLFDAEAHTLMYAVGVIEILAGLVVAFRPRVGGYVVAAWLADIIVNLLVIGDFYDIALRDFGLLLGALTLARYLATTFGITWSSWWTLAALGGLDRGPAPLLLVGGSGPLVAALVVRDGDQRRDLLHSSVRADRLGAAWGPVLVVAATQEKHRQEPVRVRSGGTTAEQSED